MNSPKTVALTGGTGFIGSRILQSLLSNGYFVRLLVRNPSKIHTDNQNIELICGDLHNRYTLKQLTDNISTVIHCAGRVRGTTAAQFDLDNIEGTKNILNMSMNSPQLQRFIHISSLSAREPSLSHYANSKRSSEQVLENSHFKQWTIIRPPAVYGPNDSELRPLFDWMRRGLLWVPGPANKRFSLLHVEDLSRLVLSQLQADISSGKTIEPDDKHSEGYSWNDVRDIASDYFQRRIHILNVSPSLLTSAAHMNVVFSKLLNNSPMLTPGKVRELLHTDWTSRGGTSIQDWAPEIDLKTGLSTLYST